MQYENSLSFWFLEQMGQTLGVAYKKSHMTLFMILKKQSVHIEILDKIFSTLDKHFRLSYQLLNSSLK